MLITFDLDGVLMLNPFGSGVFPHVRKSISAEAGVDAKEVQKAIVNEARKRQADGDMVEAYNWDDIVRKVASTYNVSWDEQIAELVQEYCTPEHIKLYPGVIELLTELSEQGHTLRALTNGFLIYQYPVMNTLGIAPYFEQILTPEAIGAGKPHRRFYLASQRGAEKPHLHIGDTVIHDVWGANLVGATSIWVKHDLTPEWKALSPRERALHPEIKDLVQAAIDRDMCPECYPELEVDAALPRYVVHHLEEVSALVADIK